MAKTKFHWGLNNSKLKALARVKSVKTAAFDLPAGYSCPMASVCQSHSDKVTGKIVMGHDAKFLCYAAKTEAVYSTSRRAHWANFDIVKNALLDHVNGIESLAQMISDDIRTLKLGIVRIHSSGDLYSVNYARVWIRVAQMNPDVSFFGYTKVMASYNAIESAGLSNLHFAFSVGSRNDNLITESTVTCTVVTSDAMRAEFPHDVICDNHHDDDDYSRDYDYIMRRESFGIAVH